MTGQVHKRVKYLDLAIEHGTEQVPDDGRYYVTWNGAVYGDSAASITVAEAYLELAEEEILRDHPEIRNPRDNVARERAFNDIISARGASRAAARGKAQQKGGKGGRGGV